jgi:structural maintenance of chromosome 2
VVTQAEFQEADRKLQEERATLTRFDHEVTELEQVIKDKKSAVSDADLKIQKLDHDLQNLRKDRAASLTKIQELEKLHSWIAEEQQYVTKLKEIAATHLAFRHFGQPGTAYDFDAQDMAVVKEKFRELEESQKGLKKNINPKVINMIEG